MRWLVVCCAIALVAAKKGKPLVVPKAKVPRATWPSAPPPKAPRFAMVAADDAMALATADVAPRALLAYTDADGVQGPIALPVDATWIGTSRGSIFVATRDGSLYRAVTLADGLRLGVGKVAQVKGAAAWDAAGGRVIVAVGTRARVSSDRGDTFIDHDFGAEVRDVFARGDGVVVAVPEDSWAWLSQDGGHTWQAPPPGLDPTRQERFCREPPRRSDDELAPFSDECRRPGAPRFQRDGDLIVAYAVDNYMDYSCVHGALAADGTTWVAPGRRRYRQPSTPFELSQTMHGTRVELTEAPPASGPSAVDESRKCMDNPAGWFDSQGGGVGAGGGGGWCRGLGCLARAPRAASDGTHLLFADAVCDHAKETCSRPATRVSMGIKGDVVVARAPCGDGWLDSQQGAAVLQCHAATGVAVHLGDRRGGWFEQEPLPIGTGLVDVAVDGTIVIAERCQLGQPCRGFVRAPRPLADRPPWTEVTMAGALAYRAVPGGRALIAGRATHGAAGKLELSMGGYGASTAVDNSYYDAWSERYWGDHPLKPVVDGCIVDAVRRGGAMTGAVTIGVDLDASGALRGAPRVTDAPDEAAAACIAAGVRSLAYRKPPRALTSERVVGYDAPEVRFSLWLADGKPPVRLVDDVDGSAGVRGLWLDGGNVKVVLGESEWKGALAVVLTDGTLRVVK